MIDEFEFTLHSPLTKEDWNKLTDAELEKTMSVTFQTPSGRQVKYIKNEVLDKIRAEIEQDAFKDVNGSKFIFVNRVNQIIDKYKELSEGSDPG